MPKLMNCYRQNIRECNNRAKHNPKPEPNYDADWMNRKFFHRANTTAKTTTVAMQQKSVANKNLFENLCFGLTCL